MTKKKKVETHNGRKVYTAYLYMHVDGTESVAVHEFTVVQERVNGDVMVDHRHGSLGHALVVGGHRVFDTPEDALDDFVNERAADIVALKRKKLEAETLMRLAFEAKKRLAKDPSTVIMKRKGDFDE